MTESKYVVAEKIEELLKATRFGADLKSVEYIDAINAHNLLFHTYNEMLVITWMNGAREEIDVSYDSGMAMIIDLAKWLKTK